MFEQTFVFGTLAVALALFIHGGLRYDMVALLALLAVVLAGVAPAGAAFAGFGHPAVVTVAAVLVVSRGLAKAGVVDALARRLEFLGSSFTAQLAALMALVLVASGFMNNVGALALLMPVAVRLARAHNRQPSRFLMPLAFGSLLGGLTTLIGTPPNLILSAFRQEATGQGFQMFDFLPVGAGTALAGLAFIALGGWRLIPRRESEGRDDLFHIDAYLTEVRVVAGSPLVGARVREVEHLPEVDVLVAGLVRGDRVLGAPVDREFLAEGDVLLVEASPADLERLLATARLELRASKGICTRLFQEDDQTGPVPRRKDQACEIFRDTSRMELMEAVVGVNSRMVGRTVRDMALRHRHGANLLAVSRQGRPMRSRLRDVRLRPGDVLLLQGMAQDMAPALPALGLFPLAERELRLTRPSGGPWAMGLFVAGVAAATFGLAPVHISLTAAAAGMVLARVLSLREAYESIEWPVIVLLGAMFPVGEALETSGGAATVADALMAATGAGGPVLALTVLLVGTMILSNVINNAAAALIMAPIALRVAAGFGAPMDPFLMAVCVGCSTPFLTPIGHQSNTLVMGPGGYRFGDYWRLGLPLSVLVPLAAVPLILVFWPL
jgi:di/tricarboxylate transporter